MTSRCHRKGGSQDAGQGWLVWMWEASPQQRTRAQNNGTRPYPFMTVSVERLLRDAQRSWLPRGFQEMEC